MSAATFMDDGTSLITQHEDIVSAFARELGLTPEVLAFMWELPIELRTSIMQNFDPSGTKDGNVLGRLQAYAKHMMRKNGLQLSEQVTTSRVLMESKEPQPMVPVPAPAVWNAGANLVELHPQPAGGIGDGLLQFVERLGLGDPAADFLSRLPEDLLGSVLRGFDPSGTKDGNVWGRLLGYVRSLWSRRLGLVEPASSFVRSLPEDVQLAVIADFDASGSKDGNVSARLMQFANHLVARGVTSRPVVHSTPVGAAPPLPRPVLNVAASCPRPQPQTAVLPRPAQAAGLGEFAQTLGLDMSAGAFLQALPAEVQSLVITTFDPSGTKDGNIWGRLLAFVRRVCARHAGVDKATVDHIKTLPEEDQKKLLLELMAQHETYKQAAAVSQGQWASNHSIETVESVAERFSQAWGLDTRTVHFLQSLPEPVRDHVLAGFDGNGTKDGNVWGRLLGFVRHTWARSLGLDQASVALVKSLPEEAQMICLTDFDPSGTKDGNVAGRLQAFVKKAMAQAGQLARAPAACPATALASGSHAALAPTVAGFADAASMRGAPAAGGSFADAAVARAPVPSLKAALSCDPQVIGFLERCGLDMSTVAFLETLPEDVRAKVMNEFDPTGTKDGNVLGRLQGYVRFLNARRRRVEEDLGGPQAKRLRHDGSC